MTAQEVKDRRIKREEGEGYKGEERVRGTRGGYNGREGYKGRGGYKGEGRVLGGGDCIDESKMEYAEGTALTRQ